MILRIQVQGPGDLDHSEGPRRTNHGWVSPNAAVHNYHVLHRITMEILPPMMYLITGSSLSTMTTVDSGGPSLSSLFAASTRSANAMLDECMHSCRNWIGVRSGTS